MLVVGKNPNGKSQVNPSFRKIDILPQSQNQQKIGVKTMKTTTEINSHRNISLPFSWLGPTTMLASLMLLRSAQEAPAVNIYTLDVPATVPWTDTGINIAAGSLLDVNATGIVHYSYSSYQVTDANGGNYDGTKFLSDMMLPNTVCVSLVGKVGGTTDPGTGTLVPEGTPGDGPGFVGTSYSQVVPTSGELFLGFNDDLSVFWDNSGSFSVTVSVVPAPEPATVALVGFGCLALLAGCRKQRSRPHKN
jgi:hypothetical protein